MKISVITINYNNREGLLLTLRSVFQQTYSNLEMIVIDGGSTDGSADLVPQFQSRIGYFVSEKDKGIYNAQNKGWQHATGDYLLFLNSGDVFYSPDVLEHVFSQGLANDILYGNMVISASDGTIRHAKMPDKIGMMQLYRDTLWHPVSFIRKSLFERFGGYDEKYKIVADYDFFCRVILKHKVSLKHIDYPIAVFDTTGLSSNPERKQQITAERKEVQNKYMSAFALFFFRLYSRLRS